MPVRHGADAPDIGPRSFVVGQEVRICRRTGDRALHALRRAEDHEGAPRLECGFGVRHGRRGTVVVVHLDDVGRLDAQASHIRRVHLDDRHRIAIGDELVILVVEPRLPDLVQASVVDKELELGLLLSRRLEHALPLGCEYLGLAALGTEFVVGVEHVGADHLVALHRLHRQLHAIVARLAQQVVGDKVARVAALAVDLTRTRLACAPEAVVEGIFLGGPLESLEALGHFGIAFLLVHHLDGVGDARGNQAVGDGLSGGIDEFFAQAHAALAVHRREVHLARDCSGEHHMRGLGQHGRVDVHHANKQTAFLRRGVDHVDHFFRRGPARVRHGLAHDLAAANHRFAQRLGVVGGLEAVARPVGHHLALAVDQVVVHLDQLVVHGNGEAGCRIAVRWFRIAGAAITFLVTTHAHPAGAAAADVVRGHDHRTHGLLGHIVVVAPDDALFEGVHGTGQLAGRLGLVAPLGGLLDLRDRQAGDAAAFVERHAIGLDGGLEAFGVLGNEVLVDPALINDVSEHAVPQRAICARVDRQMQDLILGDAFTDGNRRRAARIDKNELASGHRLVGKHLFLLVERRALQIRQPVHEEVVGLVLVGVVAVGPDHIGQFGVFVAVVQLENAHVPIAKAFGVVRWAVVDAAGRRLDRREHELAGFPQVFSNPPPEPPWSNMATAMASGPSLSRIFLTMPP